MKRIIHTETKKLVNGTNPQTRQHSSSKSSKCHSGYRLTGYVWCNISSPIFNRDDQPIILNV